MLLSLRQVTRRFPVERTLFGRPAGFVTALDRVDLSVPEGSVTGLVGESGCGKSTLARIAAGLEPPDAGEVRWRGEDPFALPPRELRRRRRLVQMVFQNSFGALDPRQRCGEAVEEPLVVHGIGNARQRREKVLRVLEDVGLSAGDAAKYPHEFSGGQRQRVALARALVLEPELLVLDEPLSSLDVSVQGSLLNLLSTLNRKRGLGYLFISHDLSVVGYLAARTVVLYLGRVVEEGPTKVVLRRPAHPYTRALRRAARTFSRTVEGEPPSPVTRPSGCPFHPRCPHAEERCRQEEQVLVSAGEGRTAACWKWERIPEELHDGGSGGGRKA